MMKYLRFLLLGVLAVLLVAIALANRAPVTLRLLAPETGEFLGFSWAVQLPLFLVIFASLLVGLLLGFVWEWMREHRIRSGAVKTARHAAWLEGEVERLKTTHEAPKDEVLALLDKTAR